MLFGKKKPVVTDEKRVDAVLSRGVDEVIDESHLRSRLLSGERLRVKLGIDPTSPHLHLGRSVPLLKVRDFQELGHAVVFIVGDFTGVIGDASDKDAERPMLTPDVIAKNKKTYFRQVGRLIDLKTAELRYNSEWLEKLDYTDVGKHADAFSVADFIARDNIRRRLDAGSRVSLREVLYPLMQGYDSVAVKADVEVGGVDQRFNLLSGRTLQTVYGQEPQDIVITTFPVEGTDGRKMSSSWGNTINFNDEPKDMFGKVMRVQDDLVERYFILLTRVPTDKIREVMSGHPKKAKEYLAREIVALYHGTAAADGARHAFVRTFSEKKIPEDVQQLKQQSNLRDTLVNAGVVASNAEWNRLIAASAVRNAQTDERVTESGFIVQEETVFKVGKKRFVKIVL